MVIPLIVTQKKYTFGLKFSSLGVAMLVHSLPMKSRKGWLVMHLILLPHMPVFFMMSLIQTAWHRIAKIGLLSTFKCQFWRNRIKTFWRNRIKTEVKKCCRYVCCPTYIDWAHDASPWILRVKMNMNRHFALLTPLKNNTCNSKKRYPKKPLGGDCSSWVVLITDCSPELICLGIFNTHTDVDACNDILGLDKHNNRICTESWLREENLLPHQGMKAASALHLAFLSDTLPAELSCPTLFCVFVWVSGWRLAVCGDPIFLAWQSACRVWEADGRHSWTGEWTDTVSSGHRWVSLRGQGL